jgi:hypothetical protein
MLEREASLTGSLWILFFLHISQEREIAIDFHGGKKVT